MLKYVKWFTQLIGEGYLGWRGEKGARDKAAKREWNRGGAHEP